MAWAIPAVMCVMLLVYAAARLFSSGELNYNEGWSAYHATRAAQGLPLYAERFNWTPLNYPPLSFHLLGAFGWIGFDPIMSGRVLSLLGFAASLSAVIAMVRVAGASLGTALFSAAVCVLAFCAQRPEDFYVAMNDPQLIAHPFLLFALVLYMRAPVASGNLFVVAALVVVGLHFKHNLVAVPFAIFLDLLLRPRYRLRSIGFLIWLGVFTLLATGLIVWLDGSAYLANLLLFPRSYSLREAVWKWMTFHSGFELALLGAFAYVRFQSRRWRVLVLYFVVSLITGVLVAGGEGVSLNAFFDEFFAMAVLDALFINFLLRRVLPKGVLFPAVVCLGFVFRMHGTGTLNPGRFMTELRRGERDFAAQVEFLKTFQGPAVCESLMLCYRAGKPFLVDPFMSRSLAKAGAINESRMLSAIERGEIAAVQLYAPVNMLIPGVERFPSGLRAAVARSYQLENVVGGVYFYVPKKKLSSVR